MTFNNQLMRPSAHEQPTQQYQPAPTDTYVDPQRELLILIREENPERLRSFLSTQASPESLVNQRDREFQQTPLYIAVQIPNKQSALAVCQVLAEFGASFRVKDIHGQSPLFYICKDGVIPLLQLALAHGADINETDHFNQTPLFYAARDGQADCIREMIRNGSNPNHRDKVNETALFYASRDGRLAAVRTLLEQGADPNVIDDKKQTALFFAKRQNHSDVIDLLISRGAINTKDGRLTKADIARATKGNLNSLPSATGGIGSI